MGYRTKRRTSSMDGDIKKMKSNLRHPKKCTVCGGRVQNRQNGVSCRVSWEIIPNRDRLIEQPMQNLTLETKNKRTAAGAEERRRTAYWWSGWPLCLGSCGADCPEPQSACPFLICYVVTRTESTKKYCSGIRVMLRDDACSVPQPDALRQWRKRILANAKAYDHTIWVHMYNFWSFLKCGSKIFNLVNYKDINYILL